MYTPINEINALAEKTSAKFISFKFIDFWGRLSQIDSLVSNLSFKDNNILIHDFILEPIENKIFLDPCRSFPTIFCLCENLSSTGIRKPFVNMLKTDNSQESSFECAIEFTAQNKASIPIEISSVNHNQSNYEVDPVDKLANLRSEIVFALETADITATHHYATGPFQGVINYKAKDFLELADNYIITKFIIENVAESYGKSIDFTRHINNEALECIITFNSSYDEKIFAEKFDDLIKNSFKNKSAFLKLNSNNQLQNTNNTQSKFVISFDNPKINPYVIFSFLNPNNYKSDNVINEKFNLSEIKTYVGSFSI